MAAMTDLATQLSATPDIAADVARLQEIFPLNARQRSMTEHVVREHRRLLNAFAREGRPPTDLDPLVLERLAAEDAIVVDEGLVTGAYPFSLVPTPHRVRIDGNATTYAMCSIDAVAISPVWGLPVHIESVCAVTGAPIRIEQNGNRGVSDPGDARLGIRWQAPCGSASASMCREMVFLAGPRVARHWQEEGGEASTYGLDEGIEFGRRFFQPLLTD